MSVLDATTMGRGGERDREGTGREKLKEQEKGAFNKDEAQIRHNLLHGIIDGVIKL